MFKLFLIGFFATDVLSQTYNLTGDPRWGLIVLAAFALSKNLRFVLFAYYIVAFGMFLNSQSNTKAQLIKFNNAKPT